MTRAMGAQVADSHVTAKLVDENTLDVNGVLFHRRPEDEVLLQPTTKAVAPRLRCSNCGFERQYAFWYRHLDYEGRQVDYCPGCGLRILGVIGHAD